MFAFVRILTSVISKAVESHIVDGVCLLRESLVTLSYLSQSLHILPGIGGFCLNLFMGQYVKLREKQN